MQSQLPNIAPLGQRMETPEELRQRRVLPTVGRRHKRQGDQRADDGEPEQKSSEATWARVR